MPLLVAIDEYRAALNTIENVAANGLRRAEDRTAALINILSACEVASETIADTMTYAGEQIAYILRSSSSN